MHIQSYLSCLRAARCQISLPKVIHVGIDCLCNGPGWMRIFEVHSSFKELVSSMTREVDNERILRVVESFFWICHVLAHLTGPK
ncbi:hypothetical protein M404DRAFT_740740 [Pisolithus tinctorius Marx 270]|uniref:Uncharacterized protein n=1 Tax=Pisolithus tinctorius Marx 270 TaxID=870435 RepID=A0A0C3IW42_PISTI|nr:hypothetical protein M404DRAFT_740740 [Pisolithus tinctorius Marx 270]